MALAGVLPQEDAGRLTAAARLAAADVSTPDRRLARAARVSGVDVLPATA